MENFMEKVENWNSLFLNGLSAAVKTHFDSIVSRGIIFEERNIEGFLSEIERENFEKAINQIFIIQKKKINLFKYIINLLYQLKK